MILYKVKYQFSFHDPAEEYFPTRQAAEEFYKATEKWPETSWIDPPEAIQVPTNNRKGLCRWLNAKIKA